MTTVEFAFTLQREMTTLIPGSQDVEAFCQESLGGIRDTLLPALIPSYTAPDQGRGGGQPGRESGTNFFNCELLPNSTGGAKPFILGMREGGNVFSAPVVYEWSIDGVNWHGVAYEWSDAANNIDEGNPLVEPKGMGHWWTPLGITPIAHRFTYFYVEKDGPGTTQYPVTEDFTPEWYSTNDFVFYYTGNPWILSNEDFLAALYYDETSGLSYFEFDAVYRVDFDGQHFRLFDSNA